MEPTPELIRQIDRQRIEDARRMSPEARVLECLRLFDFAVKITAAGIRSQYPEADERQVQRIIRQRLELMRRTEGLT
jgi:hypothetical protein